MRELADAPDALPRQPPEAHGALGGPRGQHESVGAELQAREIVARSQRRPGEVPPRASQIRIVPLKPPDAIQRPSGLKRASRTGDPSTSSRASAGRPSSASQIRIVPSSEALQHSRAIASELHPVDGPSVRQGRRGRGTRGHVPDPSRPVGRAGRKATARAIERRPVDRACVPEGTFEGGRLLRHGRQPEAVRPGGPGFLAVERQGLGKPGEGAA